MSRPNWLATSALLSTLVVCAPGTIHAQAKDQAYSSPPNILVIIREFTKPGREGSQHEKTESAYAQAARAGHSKTHYLGLTSLSGPNRTIFLSGYNSMDEWAQARISDQSNASMSNAIDQANQADGEMLKSSEQSVWRYRPDLSTNPGGLKHIRAMTFTTLRIRPGHHEECEQVIKMVEDGSNKANPNRHLAVWEEAYGSPGGGMIITQAFESAAALDKAHDLGKQGFKSAMGPDGMKRLQTTESSCLESAETNLFLMNPKMSYPADSWSDDPFWKQSSEAEHGGTN